MFQITSDRAPRVLVRSEANGLDNSCRCEIKKGGGGLQLTQIKTSYGY